MKKPNFRHFRGSGSWKFVAASLALTTLFSCSRPEDPGVEAGGTVNETDVSMSSGRYLVVLNCGDDDAAINAAIQSIQDNLAAKHLSGLSISESDIFKGAVNGFSAALTPEQAQVLKAAEGIMSMEEDKVVSIGDFLSTEPTAADATSETPPLYQDIKVNNETIPWGVSCVGARGSNGTGKTAWIIDSGILFGHPDLNVNTVRSKSFLTSIDGADYASPSDKLGHGTLVAGIIGAKANNGGVVGVAPNTSLISLRVVNSQGLLRYINLLFALNWAYNNGKAGDVVNVSLKSSPILAIDEAVKKIAAKGMFVSMAAGNTNRDCNVYSPQRVNVARAYTVSAMDAYKKFWPGSNYGSSVDYAAPGHRILSTTPFGYGYTYCSGTDFAAAHLAGLLLIKNGVIVTSGYVLNDPDAKRDPIAHK